MEIEVYSLVKWCPNPVGGCYKVVEFLIVIYKNMLGFVC